MQFLYRTATRVLPEFFRMFVKQTIAELMPEPVLLAIPYPVEQNKITGMVQKSARSFQLLRGKKGLKLHLGCGNHIKLGWVNIDLGIKSPPDFNPAAHPDTVLIEHDLRYGLPLDEGSCDYIYSSHFFEHLTNEEGYRLMRECYLKLRSGGVFRVALPTFRESFEAYIRGDYKKWFELIEGRVPEIVPAMKTPIDYLNLCIYQDGHKCIYDEESTILILQSLGYSSVAPSSYKEGMDPDSAIRRKYSFYVEAVK